MSTESLIDSQLQEGEVIAVQATNREVLINEINKRVDTSGCDGRDGMIYLHIELSGEELGCRGGIVDYKTENDIPSHSVPCPCGNPKHWLIKYTEN